ncbi:MAG: methyltransferase domain-containing protein [Gemmatimonadota bacterium]|nr:methyltransferase domain-containing protein [Gemmatimonadota bacterium]MDH3479317.1 methyltransferase domain-containing protein [Gemmatimonadota bacterium]
MAPHGRALLAYSDGDLDAELLVRRGDGREEHLSVRYFFRPPEEFTTIETTALAQSRGRVLDVGAGSGLHSLALQSDGMTVTAIDLTSEAVAVMARRGVLDARQADVFRFHDGPFDTLLMLGHGIGMVQDLAGLDRFLAHARGLVSDGGQLLVHTVDPTRTDDPAHLAYHEASRRAGRYIGEIELQFEFEGERGAACRWLILDEPTLRRHAEAAGWDCEILREEETGDYLARLARS